MSNVDDGSSAMCDSEYFAEFRQRVKDGVINDKDLEEYAVRFGKNKAGVQANLALVTLEYKSKRISASEYILVNFMTKAALGLVTAVDIKAARKVWAGSLNGGDIQAVLAANTNIQKDSSEVNSSSSSVRVEDIKYLMSFLEKVKNRTICDNDLQDYAKRFGKSKPAIGANFGLVSAEYNKKHISASEYASLNFITKAALGAIGAADIKAARRAWGGDLTGEDIQTILDNNLSLQRAFAAYDDSGTNDEKNREYFTAFLQKVKHHTVDESDMKNFALRFGKDKASLMASVALASATYKEGGVSAAEYAALNLITKAALGMITATDIKAARRSWNGHLTDEDVQGVLTANNKMLEMLSAETKNTEDEISNDEFLGLFRKNAKSGVVSDSDLQEYARRFDEGAAKANLALISEEYKSRMLSAAEYIILNLIMRAAQGNVLIADIRAARKVWGGGLTNEEVQAVLANNQASVLPVASEQNETESVSAEFVAEDAAIIQNSGRREKDSKNELNNKEYFAMFQQKVISKSSNQSDLQEYAARFGKDAEFTKDNLEIFAAEYKNRLISASKYVELSFMAKAALGSVTEADLEAVRGVWSGSLTEQEIEDVLRENETESQALPEIADEEAPAVETVAASESLLEFPELEECCNKILVSEDDKVLKGEENNIEMPIAVEPVVEDSQEIQAETANLSDKEYFDFIQKKVMDESVQPHDFKEYARRFGKDPEATRDNLRLFTMQYRNNVISGEKFAELNFMAKAALGITTAVDIKAARSAWSSGLSLKDVEEILQQKNK